MPENFRCIQAKDMMDPDANSARTALVLIVLRVVSGASSGSDGKYSNSSYTPYNQRSKAKNPSKPYRRMYLCGDTKSTSGDCGYIIESDSSNQKMWNFNLLLRDTDFKPGMVLIVPQCHPIQDMCGDQVPIISCNGGMGLMHSPITVARVPIDNSIGPNVTKFFSYPSVSLAIDIVEPFEGKCIGRFCDGQTVKEVMGGNRGCGCYTAVRNYSKVVLAHKLSIRIRVDGNDQTLCKVSSFTSRQFSDYYLSSPLPSNVTFGMLDLTDAMFRIEEAANEVVNFVNSSGGWSVYGWYKRGEIRDASNLDLNDQMKIASGDVNFHLVYARPAQDNIWAQINQRKFNVDEL